MHAARKLDFIQGPGREYWWDLLGEALKERIEQKVGSPIEWWAYWRAVEPERPYAVVFGPCGLAVTTPTMNNAGRPAHMLSVRRFDPTSVRYAIVRQQPSGGSVPTRSGHRAEASDPSPRLPLTEDMRADIQRAYRRLAPRTHPDTGGDEESQKRLNLARQVLLDPIRRKPPKGPLSCMRALPGDDTAPDPLAMITRSAGRWPGAASPGQGYAPRRAR